MVYAAQLRIFISQFDGFLDPSHSVIKSEVPDSDFLGAYIMSPVVAKSLRQGSMHYNAWDKLHHPACMHMRGGCCCQDQNFRSWVSAPCDMGGIWSGGNPSAQSLTPSFWQLHKIWSYQNQILSSSEKFLCHSNMNNNIHAKLNNYSWEKVLSEAA